MQISVKNGLMYLLDKDKEIIIDCPEADKMLCAERITKEFDGKILIIDDKTLIIKQISEDVF